MVETYLASTSVHLPVMFWEKYFFISNFLRSLFLGQENILNHIKKNFPLPNRESIILKDFKGDVKNVKNVKKVLGMQLGRKWSV